MPRLLDLIKDKEPEKSSQEEITEKPIKKPKTKQKKLIITKKAEKIDYNGIPGDIVNYGINEAHSPSIIKLMNAYEDIAGKSHRANKIGMFKALIYVSIQKLHQLQKGVIK